MGSTTACSDRCPAHASSCRSAASESRRRAGFSESGSIQGLTLPTTCAIQCRRREARAGAGQKTKLAAAGLPHPSQVLALYFSCSCHEPRPQAAPHLAAPLRRGQQQVGAGEGRLKGAQRQGAGRRPPVARVHQRCHHKVEAAFQRTLRRKQSSGAWSSRRAGGGALMQSSRLKRCDAGKLRTSSVCTMSHANGTSTPVYLASPQSSLLPSGILSGS